MAAHHDLARQTFDLSSDTHIQINQKYRDSIIGDYLSSISFNLHGLNQGRSVVRELIDKLNPDLLLLQEHWLTPANLNKLDLYFPEYVAIGKSAMELCVEQGPLRGRPFGGVATLVKRELFEYVNIIHCAERYVAIRFMGFVIVNVYMPCAGTKDRLLTIETTLQEISELMESLHGETIVLGGDMNSDLNSSEHASEVLNTFLRNNALNRCDAPISGSNLNNYTYSNDALGHYSTIDYFAVSDMCKLIGYDVIEPSVNLSDHRPIMALFSTMVNEPVVCHTEVSKAKETTTVTQLRWDHADLLSYYHLTGVHVQNLLKDFDCHVDSDYPKSDLINHVYDELVRILNHCASSSVPVHYKGFYKFWWDQELDLLKDESIKSHNLWKIAGRPRSGPCFNKYSSDKRAYKSRIRSSQQDETSCYSNDLNDALLQDRKSVV